MRKWTEKDALATIHNDGFEALGKFIKKPKVKGKAETGATGLKKLSAIDYLVNHCGYKF
jgi:hypothetical protein